MKLNFSRSALFHMKTKVSLKYFVKDCGSKVKIPNFHFHSSELAFQQVFSNKQRSRETLPLDSIFTGKPSHTEYVAQA